MNQPNFVGTPAMPRRSDAAKIAVFHRRAIAIAIPVLACAGATAQTRPQEPTPRDIIDVNTMIAAAPTARISRGDLRVTIALPDAKSGFYRSTRFDWSGMITSVTRGNSRFYGPWVDGVAANVRDFVDDDSGVFAGPRNAATGPAEEFANRDGETVPGYNAAAPGGTFLKIGVGHLRKDNTAPYDHFSAYEIVDGGKWTIRRGADRISFIQRLTPDASGYGYVYEKTIRLGPNGTMTIAHRLRNIGSNPIRTQIYNHNLARFDGAEIGPGVSVRFPSPLTGPVSNPALATIEGNDLRYTRALAPGQRVQLQPQVGNRTAPAGVFRVTGANGASITMETETPLVRAVLWSMRRTVAIEPFIAIDVSPGKEQRWAWRYTYSSAR